MTGYLDDDVWDADDRVRCICLHVDRNPPTREQCLKSTRHPSGRCGDCRGPGDILMVKEAPYAQEPATPPGEDPQREAMGAQ